MVTPEFLLLGGGYVLRQFAGVLPEGSFLITSRDPKTIQAMRDFGWQVRQLDVSKEGELEALLAEYPSLRVSIDSIPPNESHLFAESVVPVLSNANFDRLVFLSSTGVYGQSDGAWVDEDSEVQPASDRGQRRLRSEQSYLSSGVPSTCLRLSGIYGPGRPVSRRLRSPNYKLLTGVTRYTNRIHVSDIVQVLSAICLDQRGQIPDVLNVTDSCPAPMEEVVRYYCEKFEIPLPQTITPEELSPTARLATNHRVSNKRMQEFLGKELRYPNYKVGAESDEEVDQFKIDF